MAVHDGAFGCPAVSEYQLHACTKLRGVNRFDGWIDHNFHFAGEFARYRIFDCVRPKPRGITAIADRGDGRTIRDAVLRTHGVDGRRLAVVLRGVAADTDLDGS